MVTDIGVERRTLFCPSCNMDIVPTWKVLRRWCPICQRTIHRPAVTVVAPGAIAFYEQVRPIIEEACDSLGLPPRLAQRIDGRLFYTICAMGPTEDAIEAVLDRVERSGLGQIVESLDELLDLADNEEDADVLALRIEALRQAESVDWEPPPPRYSGPVPHATGSRTGALQLEAMGLLNQGYTDCWICGKDEGRVYVVPKFMDTEEVCNTCLSWLNNIRELAGKPLYTGLKERM